MPKPSQYSLIHSIGQFCFYSHSPTHLLIHNYPFMTLQSNFSNTSYQEHSLSFSQQFSYAMPLLRTMPFLQLLLHVHFLAFIHNPLLVSILFRTPNVKYPSIILCTTSLSCPLSAATCDPRYFKCSTSSNGSSFSMTCTQTSLKAPLISGGIICSEKWENHTNNTHNKIKFPITFI